jgi:hypothetical protein
MSEKYAPIIANTEYTDPGLSQLTAPGKDAKDIKTSMLAFIAHVMYLNKRLL